MWGDIWTAEYDTEPYDTEMHDPVIIDYANQPRTDVLQAGKTENCGCLITALRNLRRQQREGS